MRTSPARDELELALEALADDIEVRVLIAEKDQELLVGDSYHITVFFIADQLVWESDPRRRQSIQQAFSTFVSTLKACDGVEVDEESEVRSGENFSWQETRETDEWNFANLSYVD
jgi:hypothetical protein